MKVNHLLNSYQMGLRSGQIIYILRHDFNITRNAIAAPIVRDIYRYLSHQDPPSLSSNSSSETE